MRTADPRLQQFIEASKAKGASDEGLAAILSREGWPVSQVYAALGDYWARTAGMEIPTRAGRGESSREGGFTGALSAIEKNGLRDASLARQSLERFDYCGITVESFEHSLFPAPTS